MSEETLGEIFADFHATEPQTGTLLTIGFCLNRLGIYTSSSLGGLGVTGRPSVEFRFDLPILFNEADRR